MHPRIAEFSNEETYKGEHTNDESTITGRGLTNNRIKNIFLNESYPIVFIDTKSRECKISDCYINTKEALNVSRILKSLLRSGVESSDIGIITFYSSQVREIFEKTSRFNRDTLVGSVDAF